VAALVKDPSAPRISPDGTAGDRPVLPMKLGEIIYAKLRAGALHAPIRRLPPDVHLYSWGDRGDWLYLINSGWVKCMTWAWSGKPCLLDINGPTAVLGVSGILTSRRAETAMTKTVAEISVIARSQLNQIVDNPIMHEAWNQHLTAHIVEQQEALTHFVTLDSEHRLAMTLLRLGRKLGSRNGPLMTITCRITHDELAQMVGTTRSRIGYFLKRFEGGWMVSRVGHCLVLHEDRLCNYLLTTR
jgi:CRP/FNR family transcriptional regulator, cyclic AMP receptor protein